MAHVLHATGLDHVVLYCRDTDVAKAFYEDVLGLRTTHHSEAYVFLRCGDQTIALFRAERPSPSDRRELNHVAFAVAERYDDILAGLAAHGIEVETRANDPRCIYIDDPDGHRIQILSRG